MWYRFRFLKVYKGDRELPCDCICYRWFMFASLFKWSHRAEPHMGPDGASLEENTEAKLTFQKMSTFLSYIGINKT